VIPRTVETSEGGLRHRKSATLLARHVQLSYRRVVVQAVSLAYLCCHAPHCLSRDGIDILRLSTSGICSPASGRFECPSSANQTPIVQINQELAGKKTMKNITIECLSVENFVNFADTHSNDIRVFNVSRDNSSEHCTTTGIILMETKL
jgi:hypothetical protein